jgi:hypothetical protein
MSYWLKSLGTGSEALPRFWMKSRADALEAFACPKDGRPSFEVGDRVIYYASGWQTVFAAVEVTQEAEHNPNWRSWQGTRWPWVVRVQPLLLVPDLNLAPHVTMAAIDTLSVRSQSHIHLTPEQYYHAVMSMTSVAMLPSESLAA